MKTIDELIALLNVMEDKKKQKNTYMTNSTTMTTVIMANPPRMEPTMGAVRSLESSMAANKNEINTKRHTCPLYYLFSLYKGYFGEMRVDFFGENEL